MKFYRRNYLCACEGQQEELYLNHLERLLNDPPRKVIKFNTVIDSPHRLHKTYVEYDRVALFDHDLNEVQFRRNIETCHSINKALKTVKGRKGVQTYHAYSNVNFDLWLILHKEDFNRPVTMNNAYLGDIRRIYGLSSGEDIKSKDAINRILAQITLPDVKSAISRAERIRSGRLDSDRIMIGSTMCYPNPDFSIHEFLKIVLADYGTR